MNFNTKTNVLSMSVSLALASGLAATSGVAFAQQDGAAELDRIEVTGSRIKRTDVEGALPVTVIDRQQIELSGEISVADLLRNQPFNSFGSFRPQSGSSAQSFAGLSLRGLGTGRTLILIDGRRAPVAPNVGSAQDLNSIPLAAVERIEILSDGASAIYGTDAIGGVVNIITRKDFNGVEINAGVSKPRRDGGETEEGSIIFGISGDRGRLLAGFGYHSRGIVFQRERPWSAGRGASTFSNNFADFGSPTPGTFLAHPTFGSVVPGAGCVGPGFSTVGSGTSLRCVYDFTLQAADEAEVRNQSLFTRAAFEINDDWTTYLNSSVSRVKSFGRYAPVPSSPFPPDPLFGRGYPFIPVGSPNHPATPPSQGGLNPAWEQYQALANSPLWLLHRFAALGPRDTNTDANVYDVLFGVEGRIGRFDLDIGVRQTDSQYYDLGRNYVVGAIAQQFITDGRYNIYDPFGNPRNVLDGMIATINRDGRFLQREFYALANTDLFEMGGGMSQIAFGFEYRSEDYQDIYDTLSSSGQIVGSAGNSAFGGRNVKAGFFEVLFPILDNLEASLAGRYDRYSDYGSDFSPKLSMRWQPLDQLTLRGSVGQGFRAPPLNILAAQPSFSADSVIHPPTAASFGLPNVNQSIQVTTWVIANPNLDSENSDQWSLGAAFEPLEWLNGSLDYYNIKVKNRIAGIGSQTLINCLEGRATNCPPGISVLNPNLTPPVPGAGLGVAFEAGPNSPIRFVQRGFTNLGTIRTDGLDLNLRTNFDIGNYGTLRNALQVTHVRRYRTDAGANVVRAVGVPRHRAILANTWSWGDYTLAWNVNYVGKQDESLEAGTDGRTPSWVTHDLQASWEAPWNGRLALGVQNLADKGPPLDPGYGRGFNFDLYDGYGRVPYVRYTQRF
jgi:iron complex outermembrane receptor protein